MIKVGIISVFGAKQFCNNLVVIVNVKKFEENEGMLYIYLTKEKYKNLCYIPFSVK